MSRRAWRRMRRRRTCIHDRGGITRVPPLDGGKGGRVGGGAAGGGPDRGGADRAQDPGEAAPEWAEGSGHGRDRSGGATGIAPGRGPHGRGDPGGTGSRLRAGASAVSALRAPDGEGSAATIVADPVRPTRFPPAAIWALVPDPHLRHGVALPPCTRSGSPAAPPRQRRKSGALPASAHDACSPQPAQERAPIRRPRAAHRVGSVASACHPAVCLRTRAAGKRWRRLGAQTIPNVRCRRLQPSRWQPSLRVATLCQEIARTRSAWLAIRGRCSRSRTQPTRCISSSKRARIRSRA